MSDIENQFEAASAAAKNLDERPDNDTLLQLYALYKPGFFDFVGLAKYEAWEKIQGVSTEDAMQQYIDLVRRLGATVD